MTDFKQALRQFLAGDIKFSLLETTLANELAVHPDAGAELLALLNSLYAAGRLPTQLHQLLLKEIHSKQMTPPPPDPFAAEFGEDDDGKTRIRFRRPAEPVPPASDAGEQLDSDFGASRGTDHTGQTGGTGPSTTGSSWGDPAQWTETDGGTAISGSILKGRFILERVIGQGAMGIVFLAKDLRKEEARDRNPYLAVKILNEKFKQHPESLKALQRESRKTQELAHPNIVNVFDFDRDAGNVFMTMEYMEGEPLDVFLKRHVSQGLPLNEALPIIRQLGRALAYAHERGIIHSDFKPANAFLTTEDVVKVFDFGIARSARRSDQAAGEMTLFDAGTLGALTPAYATIGMIVGQEPDQRDDIYALACVAYQLLTGEHPFKMRSALEASKAGMVPVPVDCLDRRQWRALQTALSFDRAEQPATVNEFIECLEPQKIDRTRWALGGIAALLVIGVLANWVPSYLHERHLNALVETLQSGADSEIALIIDELENELTVTEQSIVFRSNDRSSTALFDYFQRGIDNAIGIDSNDSRTRNAYDYAAAAALVERAHSLFPDSVAAETMRGRIGDRKEEELAIQRERLKAAIQNKILLTLQGPESAEEILGIVAIVEPGHELLTDPGLIAVMAVDARLALDDDDLNLARALVDAGVRISPAEPLFLELDNVVNAAIVAAELEADRQFNARMQDMLDDIRQQEQAGRFAPPNEHVAHEMLQALQNAGAEIAVVTSARQVIAFGYLQMARRARGAGEFESARTLANLINQHQPDATMTEILRQELADIDAAQQGATRSTSETVAQQPAADTASEIDSLQRQFESTINGNDLTLEDGRTLVSIVGRLQNLGAGDDIVIKWTGQIEVALLKRSLAFADAGDLQAALSIAVGTRELLPDSSAARAVVDMLELDHREVLAKQSAEQERLAENRLGQLMAQPTVDMSWLDEVLLVRGELNVDAAFEQTSNKQIAAKLAQQIDLLASTEQFSEARLLLNLSTALLPDNSVLLLAGNDLQTALDEFEQREQEEQLQSAISAIANQSNAGELVAGTASLPTAGGQEGLLAGSWQGVESGGSGYLHHIGDRVFGTWKKSGLPGRVDLTVRDDGKIEGALSQEKVCSYKKSGSKRINKFCTIQSQIEFTHASTDRLEGTIRVISEPDNPIAQRRACESCYETEIRMAQVQKIGWQRTEPGIVPASASNGDSKWDTRVEKRPSKRIYYAPPKYPSTALRRNVSGWVSLEFTVTTVGDVVDIQVLDSEPKKTFDAAAIRAVEQWLYDPVIEDFEPMEKRLTVRLGFDLQ